MAGNDFDNGHLPSELELQGQEYERKTLYLRTAMKDDLEDWLNIKEVTNPVFDEADTRQIYEAIIGVAMQHESELEDELRELMAADNEQG